VDDEFIDASHCVEWALTGKLVIEVFHTLSEGNPGHVVPGNVVPTTRVRVAGALVATAAESTVTTEPNTLTITARPLRVRCTRRRRSGMSAEYHSSKLPKSARVRIRVFTGISMNAAGTNSEVDTGE
jgi:hypothetical protein